MKMYVIFWWHSLENTWRLDGVWPTRELAEAAKLVASYRTSRIVHEIIEVETPAPPTATEVPA